MENNGKIIWNNEFSIGNSDIDAVHKSLIDIYNNMIEFNESKGNREEFAIILSKMTEYAMKHFKKEEEYMKKMAYPKFSSHKSHHKSYIYKVSMYNIDLLGVDPPEANEVIDFLKKWWVNHILLIDKKYEDYKKEIHSTVVY